MQEPRARPQGDSVLRPRHTLTTEARRARRTTADEGALSRPLRDLGCWGAAPSVALPRANVYVALNRAARFGFVRSARQGHRRTGGHEGAAATVAALRERPPVPPFSVPPCLRGKMLVHAAMGDVNGPAPSAPSLAAAPLMCRIRVLSAVSRLTESREPATERETPYVRMEAEAGARGAAQTRPSQ